MLFEGKSRGSYVVCGIGIEGGRIELSFIEHSLVIKHLVNKHIQAYNQTSIPSICLFNFKYFCLKIEHCPLMKECYVFGHGCYYTPLPK